MTRRNNRALPIPNVLAGVGLAGAILGAVANPNTIPVIAAAAGGSLVTASLVADKKDRKKEFDLKAAKVEAALKYCYETGKGLVAPQQLAFHAAIELSEAEKFLASLVDTGNGGQKVDTPVGVVYSFDHPEQVLNQLSQNAINWADAQTNDVLRENAVLKQQLQLLSAAAQTRVPAAPTEVFQQNNGQPPVGDPWKGLL